MKLVSTLVTGAFALAVSVQAGDCTAGMNYCADVLNDISMAALQLFSDKNYTC